MPRLASVIVNKILKSLLMLRLFGFNLENAAYFAICVIQCFCQAGLEKLLVFALITITITQVQVIVIQLQFQLQLQ